MTIELAVLDIAGTTVDEGGAVYRVLADVVRAHGAEPADADIRAWMGADTREAIATLLGVPAGHPVVATAHRSFVAELAAAYRATPPVPFPGVDATLAALRAAGVKVALTTGFDRQVTDPLLAAVGWRVPDTLDAVVCADEVAAGRPAPYLIRWAMQLTGVSDPGNVLVAGDTVLDIRAGRAARAGLVIGVLTGAQTAAELTAAEPTRLVESVADLPDILGVAWRAGSPSDGGAARSH
jgi:phosphoglycolate phosphatase